MSVRFPLSTKPDTGCFRLFAAQTTRPDKMCSRHLAAEKRSGRPSFSLSLAPFSLYLRPFVSNAQSHQTGRQTQRDGMRGGDCNTPSRPSHGPAASKGQSQQSRWLARSFVWTLWREICGQEVGRLSLLCTHPPTYPIASIAPCLALPCCFAPLDTACLNKPPHTSYRM